MPRDRDHKSKVRDKPAHSKMGGGIARMKVKKGGAGARSWGKLGDEINYENDRHYLNEKDPNYDPSEQQASAPPPEMKNMQARFVSHAQDLAQYKRSIKDAVDEYLASNDAQEFARIVVELDMTVFHQELTKIIVTKGLEQKAGNRANLSHLMSHLHLEGHLTANQSKQGFLKIYHRIGEITLDNPNAVVTLREFTDHAVANGFLTEADVAIFEAEVKLVTDCKNLGAVKQQIRGIVTEYLNSEDVSDLSLSVEELKAPQLGYEVVKRLIYAGCDGKDRAKELVSVFLAECSRDVLPSEQIAKGFTILLNRCEDMHLDTPNIFQLLSTFIARAVIDEAIPPSFIVRQDLTEHDMGYQVVLLAQALVNQPHAAARLSNAWGGSLHED